MANYKNLDVSASLKISKPKKVNGIYQSDTSFKVQTPELTVDLEASSITFRMIKKGKFVTLLEELENKIVSTIYNNSTDFFNGKTFTENKIRDSLEKLFTLDNEGLVTLNNVTIPSNLKVYDHFNELLPQGQSIGKVAGVCILQVGSVQFVKSSIKVNITLTHLKLSVEKKKLTECILDDVEESPEIVPVIVEESHVIVEESPEIVEAAVDPEVPEYTDFFEE